YRAASGRDGAPSSGAARWDGDHGERERPGGGGRRARPRRRRHAGGRDHRRCRPRGGGARMSDFFVGLMLSVSDAFLAFFDRPFYLVLRDCVDIGLVATLIYLVLAVIKGTRAMQMAIGLALMVVFYFLV